MNKGIDISKVDISGPWRPGCVGMSIYGEAQAAIKNGFRTRNYDPYAFAHFTAKVMGHVDKACAVTDVVIYKMMADLGPTN